MRQRETTQDEVSRIISEMKRKAALAPRAPGKDRSTAGKKAWETYKRNLAEQVKAGTIAA